MIKKYQKMKKQLLFLALLVTLFIGEITAKGTSKRFDFAKAYFGLDLNYVPNYGASQYFDAGGNLQNFDRSAYFNPAINIGATHFWGFTDIYISIATSNIKTKEDAIPHNTDFGVFTGIRVYPLQLKNNNLRPYIGYKFSPFRYSQDDLNGNTSKLTQVKSVLDIGLGYRLPSWYAYIGYNRVTNPSIEPFISRTDDISTTVPQHFFNVGMNWMIETTKGTDNPANRYLNDLFSSSNADGLFFGVGPSAAFPILDSEYISDLYPFLDQKSMPTTFPDISLGYHFTKPDVIISSAFRPITQIRTAQNFTQKINRTSVVAEVYKFLGDYHGFSPYVGGGIGFEKLRLREEDNEVEITDISQNKLTPLLTFGWDIRPARKGDFWLLRTNLRYSPTLDIKHNDKSLSLQHLEFNFIQFVFYPQRYKAFKTYLEKGGK